MKLQNTKKVTNVVKQTVDHETGEITDQTVELHYVSEVKTENFFMCFFENFGAFLGLKSAKDKNLIACMCAEADFNTGVVHMTTRVREKLCQQAGISVPNVSRNLNRLVAAGLISEDRGDYTINPGVFWKGTTKSRTEILQNGGLIFKVQVIEPGASDE